MYIGKCEILADFNLAVAKTDRQTTKFFGHMVVRTYSRCLGMRLVWDMHGGPWVQFPEAALDFFFLFQLAY